MRRFVRHAAVAVVLLSLVAGCTSSGDSDDDAAPDDDDAAAAIEEGEVLVGEVDGGRGLVAVVHTSTGVTVYTCGFDEQVDTHTGWFNGEPVADGDDRVIPTLTSAGGLTLDGRITGDEASGTLTLASGEVVDWSADRSSGNGSGVYASEDAFALAGLIVAEDERMVGSATTRIPPPGTGSTTPPTIATTTTTAPTTTSTTRPATTTSTRPASTPTTLAPVLVPSTTTAIIPPPTRPSTSTTTVTTTFPTSPTTTTTTTLTPITRPRVVTRTGPVIIFLVHGMSENATTPGVTAREDPIACDAPRNSPMAGRCEFGPDFIPGLFGGPVGSRLVNFAGQDVTGNRYISDRTTRPVFDETMGLAQGTNGCAVDPTATERHDPLTARHFVSTTAPVTTAVGSMVPPQLSVFTTWRDSTTGVVESGRRLARQAYAAARWWEETFRLTPSIIFLPQSFGGLATRFVMSNPSDAAIANPQLNPGGVRLCPEDHARMDWLRDRTDYVVTMATPHEGSFLAEVGEGGKDLVRGAIAGLTQGVAGSPIAEAVRAIDASLATVAPGTPSLADATADAADDLLQLLNSPALNDLRLPNMLAWNRGPLSPDLARRTPASPMVGAARQLVPIYATMARTPGSTSFDSPLMEDNLATYATERPKEQGWIFMTSVLAETIVTQFSSVGWGAINGPLAPFAEILDRRQRLFDLSTETAAAEQFVEDAAEGILGSIDPWFFGAFGGALEGVQRYLESIDVHAFFPTALIPIYVDRVWRIELTGSVEVPMLAFACGDNEIVLDYQPLIEAALAVQGGTRQWLDAVQSGDLARVMEAAGASIDDGVGLAADTMAWFSGKVNDLGDDAGEDCELPTDPAELIADPTSVDNLANWTVTEVTGTVPAPEWVRTDEVARDGEQDTDGAVHAASALGLQLGRDPFFFEHDRGGSWYRIPTEPITEQYNHGFQYQNDVGVWIRDRFLRAGVGPVPQANGDSAWTA